MTKPPRKQDAKKVLKETRRANDERDEPSESELYDREYRRQGRVPSTKQKQP